ncbi:MAG: fibro-slime domain-containing protein [Byssovorax sp.]
MKSRSQYEERETVLRSLLSAVPRGRGKDHLVKHTSRLRLAGSLAASMALLGGCDAGGDAGGKTTSSGAGGATPSTSSASGTGGDVSFTGGGGATGTGSTVGSGGAPDCTGLLTVVIRDFTTAHPDFEQGNNIDDPAIVTPDLGADGKPVYAGAPGTPTTHGKASFDAWYNDKDGVNQDLPIKIQLTKGANGLYTYDDQEFFPIDGKGFGDEGNPHNYHFTDEVHTQFTYVGGETFTFTGDDDLFGYINKKLVINLGGVHSAETKVLALDSLAVDLGLVKGKTYPLDLFGAERHVTGSHYRIDTTIDCFIDVPPPK